MTSTNRFRSGLDEVSICQNGLTHQSAHATRAAGSNLRRRSPRPLSITLWLSLNVVPCQRDTRSPDVGHEPDMVRYLATRARSSEEVKRPAAKTPSQRARIALFRSGGHFSPSCIPASSTRQLTLGGVGRPIRQVLASRVIPSWEPRPDAGSGMQPRSVVMPGRRHPFAGRRTLLPFLPRSRRSPGGHGCRPVRCCLR